MDFLIIIYDKKFLFYKSSYKHQTFFPQYSVSPRANRTLITVRTLAQWKSLRSHYSHKYQTVFSQCAMKS